MNGKVQPIGASRYRTLGRNVALKHVAETSRLFQIMFFLVVARRFGPTGLGDITLLLMIGSVAALVFGDLGLNVTVIARMSGSAEPARSNIASAGLLWKTVLSILSFIAMIAAMALWVRVGTWSEILAAALISCGSIWHEFIAALTNGMNRFEVEAWFRPLYRALVYGSGAAVCLFSGLEPALWCMGVAAIVVSSFGLGYVSGRLVQLEFPASLNVRLLRESVPVWITQLSQLTFFKLDIVLLGILHVGVRETGWYAGAWKIVDVLTTVPALLAGAVLPLISGDSPGTDASAIAPGYLKAMYALPFLFVLPLAVGANWVSRVLYGTAFVATARSLGVLVWALVPIGIHSFLANVAVATNRQYEAAKAGAFAASVGLAAAALLVPRLGYEWMAIISLAANFLFGLLLVVRFRDVTGSMQISVGLKALASALSVYAASLMFVHDIPAPVLMIGAAGSYGVMLLLLGVVTFKDVSRGWRVVGARVSSRSAERISAA